MAIKPETAIVNAIERWVLGRPNSVILKVYGNGMTTGGHPDLIGSVGLGMNTYCHFAIEVKLPGKDPTPRQLYRLRQWESGGYVTGVAHSLEEFRSIVYGDS